MVDTYTTSLQLNKQEVGSNENTWGQLLNDEVIQRIEDAIAGKEIINSTGGTVTLSDDQARKAILQFTGTLSSNCIVVVPTRTKTWTIHNLMSLGAYSLTIKTAAQTSPVRIISDASQVFCDGTNVVNLSPRNGDIGSIIMSANYAEPGYLPCDGSAVSRTTYAALFAKISTMWGVGDGSTTFNLPNFADRYPRGLGFYVIGGFLPQTIINHTHSGTTSSDGSHSHTVNINDPWHRHEYTIAGAPLTGLSIPSGGDASVASAPPAITNTSWNPTGISASTVASGSHTHTFTTGNPSTTGGTETRPNSVVVNFLIRFV